MMGGGVFLERRCWQADYLCSFTWSTVWLHPMMHEDESTKGLGGGGAFPDAECQSWHCMA